MTRRKHRYPVDVAKTLHSHLGRLKDTDNLSCIMCGTEQANFDFANKEGNEYNIKITKLK